LEVFVAEWTEGPLPEKEPISCLLGKEHPGWWVMYIDGAFSLEEAGVGMLLVSSTGEHLKYIVQLAFSCEDSTNNTAEYKGLLADLRIIAGVGISRLVVRGDSHLVVNQVNKSPMTVHKCGHTWMKC
jgi:ribonuclease HI